MRRNFISILGGNGKVGIGITSPTDELHVDGIIRAEGYLRANELRSTAGTHYLFGLSGNSVRMGSGNSAHDLSFYSGAQERMTINTDGDMSILGHVNIGGNGNKALNVRHVNGKSHTSSATDDLYLNYNTGKKVLIGHFSDQASNLLVSGDIGVGTVSPAAKLDVDGDAIFKAVGSADVAIQIRSSDGGTNSMTLRGYSDRGEIFAQNNRDFSIRDNAQNILFYGKYGGNVGIGTVAPIARLEVRGNAASYSDFANYNGVTENGTLPNGKEATLVISEEVSGTLQHAVGGQKTYKGGLSFGKDGSGIYSVNPNPAGSSKYGDIRFHTTYWNGSDFNNADRMIISHTGNVGVGTVSPTLKMHLYEENTTSRTSITDLLALESSHTELGFNGFGTGIAFYGRTYQNPTKRVQSRIASIQRGHSTNDFGNALVFETIETSSGNAAPLERMRIEYNGNVGIGTSTPTYSLDVEGGAGATARFKGNGQSTISLNDGTNDNYIVGLAGDISFRPSGTQIMNLKDDGVAIGTTDPGTYKLAVEGKIGARSVKVTQANWADYVFAPSYELMPLSEVENFISQNQHLPNVPSAKEVEENGFVLEQMDAKLMEKIEELTLYMIDQEKRLKEQEQQLQAQREEIETLKQNITTK